MTKLSALLSRHTERQQLISLVNFVRSMPDEIVDQVLSLYDKVMNTETPECYGGEALYTFDQVIVISGWWRSHWIAKDIATKIVTLTAQQFAHDVLNWDQQTVLEETDFIVELLLPSEVERDIAEQVVKRASALYGTTHALDVKSMKKFKQEILTLMNDTMSSFHPNGVADNLVFIDDGVY